MEMQRAFRVFDNRRSGRMLSLSTRGSMEAIYRHSCVDRRVATEPSPMRRARCQFRSAPRFMTAYVEVDAGIYRLRRPVQCEKPAGRARDALTEMEP